MEFYSREQRKFFRHYLDSNKQCELCASQATDVHHRLDRRDGGDDGLRNLQALCHSCHMRITSRRTYARTRRPPKIDPLTGIYRGYGKTRTGREVTTRS